jgi:hypothetical protein
MNTLYFLPIGNALYWSTNIEEITAFSNCFGLLGQVECREKKVAFEIPNVICVHKF